MKDKALEAALVANDALNLAKDRGKRILELREEIRKLKEELTTEYNGQKITVTRAWINERKLWVSYESADRYGLMEVCPECNDGVRADGLAECNACGGSGKIEIDTGDGISDNEPQFEPCEACG